MFRNYSIICCVGALLFSLLFVGCLNREVSFVEASLSPQDDRNLRVSLNRNIDILWVIDNSGSMEKEQAALAANFPVFIDVLSKIDGGLPSIHMGIATTDIGAGGFLCNRAVPGQLPGQPGDTDGDSGELLVTPTASSSCTGVSVTNGDNFLQDIPDPNNVGVRIRNYSTPGSEPSLAQAFSCYATRGIDGCGFEQPLEAMRRVLSNPQNISTNQSTRFLRPDAHLAVIFITDEDDCSASDNSLFSDVTAKGELANHNCFEHGVVCEPDSPLQVGVKTGCRSREDSDLLSPVEEYAQFLRQLKTRGNEIIVASIQGEALDSSGNATVKVIDAIGKQSLIPGKDLEKLCLDPLDDTAGADPGFRLAEFLGKFPQRNLQTSICGSDFSGTLDQIADLLSEAVRDPCLDGNLTDIDVSAGIQPNCEVQYIEDGIDPQRIPQCSSANPSVSEQPCWAVTVDATLCSGTDTQLAIEIFRTQDSLPGIDQVSCQLDP